MERQQRFEADVEGVSDSGVSGPARPRARSLWASKDTGSTFDCSLIHDRFAAAVGQVLGQSVETGFMPCVPAIPASGFAANLHTGSDTVVRLSLSAGVADQLVARRFGGTSSPTTPVFCAATQRIAAPAFTQLVDEFIGLWLKEGVTLARSDGEPTSFASSGFDFALQLGTGEIRVRYGSGFRGVPQPVARGPNGCGLNTTSLRITAVIAQPSLSLRTFAHLSVGDVVPLGRCDGLALFAGEQQIASGELVAVGEQRGVRVTSLAEAMR